MISVIGTGRASAQPDVVHVRMTATAVRPTLTAALADSEEAARRIRAALTHVGVAAADATTLSLSAHAEQVWTEQQGSRVTGFRAEHELAVTLRELASAGRILGEALVAGGDDVRLNGVDFVVEDDTRLRVQARDAAWRDALERATQLVTLAGHRLGEVRSITEQSGLAAVPVPVARAATARAVEIEVQPGSVAVEVALSVQWAIA